jgi:hypothetical protein
MGLSALELINLLVGDPVVGDTTKARLPVKIPPNMPLSDTTRLKQQIDGQDKAYLILNGQPRPDDPFIRAHREEAEQNLLGGMNAQQDTLASLLRLAKKKNVR